MRAFAPAPHATSRSEICGAVLWSLWSTSSLRHPRNVRRNPESTQARARLGEESKQLRDQGLNSIRVDPSLTIVTSSRTLDARQIDVLTAQIVTKIAKGRLQASGANELILLMDGGVALPCDFVATSWIPLSAMEQHGIDHCFFICDQSLILELW